MNTKTKRIKRTQKDFTWTQWSAKDIKKAAQQYIDQLSQDVETILKINDADRTFENTFWALAHAGIPYAEYGSFISILANCSTRASVRDAARDAQSLIHAHTLEIVHRPEVYQALATTKKKLNKKDFDTATWKYITDTMNDFKRSGFTLEKKQFRKLQKNLKTLNALSIAFDKAIADYDKKLVIKISQAKKLGLPDSYLQTLVKKNGAYHIGSIPSQSGTFMSYCTDAVLRKRMLHIVSRKGGVGNLHRLQKALAVRQENARLLGYPHHAAYVLDERMAKKQTTVVSFHQKIFDAIKPWINKDISLIKHAKKSHTGSSDINPEDSSFYVRMLEQERFNIDPEEVRKYFQLEKVLVTMFSVAGRLFGITIKQKKWNLWHGDVRMYEISKDKQIMGYIAMDLHPRAGKYTHAMAHDMHAAGITQWGGVNYQTPSTVIVANFRSPSKKQPSLLSFGEVTTLFHEFGHALHNTLTTVTNSGQAGFHTTWDFVELPSQIFEEWAWLPKVMKQMSSHIETKKTIPSSLIDQILASRYFLAPLSLSRQIGMGAFDIDMHTKQPKQRLDGYVRAFMKKYTPIPRYGKSLFPASFGHLMHGYDAGYYSYLWSKVYAYDCFSRFQKEGVMSAKIGKQYWKEILSVGSSRDEIKSLQAFLGRKPSVVSFIKHIKSSIKKLYE